MKPETWCWLVALVAAELFAAKPPTRWQDAPKVQARAEILWTKPICVESGRYVGWPTVCRLHNGELMAVFSGDRDEHICPWGKVQMIRSRDDGETWSAPRIIANGPLDDRDAGIVQLPDGEIVVTYFTSIAYRAPDIMKRHPDYRRHDEKISEETVKAALGYFRLSSRDNGETWTCPQKMDVVHAPHGPALLKDGSLLMLGRAFRSRDSQGKNRNDFTVIGAARSTDGARTWMSLCPEIADRNGENSVPGRFHEPFVVEADDGTLVGMVRYHGPDGHLRQTTSKDGGRTWTPMSATKMLGLPPHLVKLSDGTLVNVYGRRVAAAGFGEFACISTDHGVTWDVEHEIVLAPSHCGDLGYPASCVLPDDTLVTVFYQQPAPGVKPCLFATKWRVKGPKARNGVGIGATRATSASDPVK